MNIYKSRYFIIKKYFINLLKKISAFLENFKKMLSKLKKSSIKIF